MFNKLFVKDKSFYRLLASVSLPIILQNVITIGVNMLDTIMLGSFGEVQLSSSSLANDFINIFQILCMGVGCGAAVLTAQFWGSKNFDDLKKSITLMFRISLVLASVFTIVILLFSKQIMNIYTSDIDVITKGSIYFMWSIPTFFLMAVSYPLTQILRSVQIVNISLYASIVSFFVNIFFNWVFIFGHFGAPQMEIAGAALGTVIARFVETGIIAIYFFVLDKQITYRVYNLKDKVSDLIHDFTKYSLPVIASDLLLGFGNTAVSVVIGHIGTIYTAGYAIVATIQRLITVFTSGIGMAAHTIIGNHIGKGLKEQVHQEAITMLSLVTIIGIVSCLIMKFSGPLIIDFYNIEPETVVITEHMNDAMAIMIIFQAIQSVITKGILRGGGDTFFALTIDAVFLWIVSVPLGTLVGLVWHLDAFFVILALKIDLIIKSIVGIYRIISKKWINNVTV